jgi:hypothetical protein
MRVRIDGPDGAVLDIGGNDPNVLTPLDEGERAAAIQALVGALVLLVGVTHSSTFAATATAPDPHCVATEQRHRGHRSGVVVPLRGQSGVRDAPSTSATPPPDHEGCR